MGVLNLEIKALLENVTNLQAGSSDYRYHMKVQCGKCGEMLNKSFVYVCADDEVDVPGGKGGANFVCKCKLCNSSGSISIVPKSQLTYTADDGDTWKKFVSFESRGITPVEFSLNGGTGLTCTGVSDNNPTKFDELEFEEDYLGDFDEKIGDQVCIERKSYVYVYV